MNVAAPKATKRSMPPLIRPLVGAEALWTIGAMALSLIVAIVVWHLWDANLRVPIFPVKGDAAWTLVSVKGIMQHGWYESNPSLGAPFGQLNYDFPVYVGETAKVLMVKIVALALSNPVVVLNFLILAGFPLIALTGFLVLRALNFSRGVAVVCSVLFATSPIHFLLAPAQAWLAIYVGVPFSGYLIIVILGNRPLFAKRTVSSAFAGTRWLSRRSIITLVMCVVVGCSGLNYAEFTCILVGVGAVLMFALRRRIGVLVTGVIVIAAITIPVIASAAPDLAYRAEHGTNQVVAHRIPAEVYEYALQPIQLVLPQVDDRIPFLGHFTERIDADLSLAPRPFLPMDLGPEMSVGLISALGLIWLLWVLIATALGRRRDDPLAGQAAVAALLAILIAMGSGGSVLFNYLVTASLQVWTRISLLIAFFAVVGLALLLERAYNMIIKRVYGRWLAWAVLAVVLVAGVFEGTSNRFVPAYSELDAAWHVEAAFVAEVQHAMPANSMVLELPIVGYPEAALATGFTSYEPTIPYLHSTTLRWSGGAMSGRSTDWLASWATQPTDELIEGAVAAGFKGVYIQRSGYSDQGAAVAAAIQALTGAPPLSDPDGSAVFFNLEGYATHLRAKLSATQLAELRRATIFPLSITYGQGFDGMEPGAGEPRWGAPTDIIAINNPAKSAQTANYTVTLVTGYPIGSEVLIKWPDNSESQVVASNRGVTLRRLLTLPPGESTIKFTTNAPRVNNPTDPRQLYLHFAGSILVPSAYSTFSKTSAASVPADQNAMP
jgi:hypothetical protein